MDFSPDAVLTLDDLATWSLAGTALAVLGHPIGHSLSPAMHNAALAEMSGRDPAFAGWRYFRFDVPPERLAEALGKLHVAGFLGVNLTVPHKVLACALVREIAHEARPVGAVNTLRRISGGWRGFNTDGYGLATALRAELGVSLHGAHVVLLGAGGAARGAAVECLQQGCASLWIANRSAGRLDELLAVLRPLPRGASVRGFAPAAPPGDLPAGALIVNATSAGLKPGDPVPIDLRRLPRPASVYDMIYNPARTSLLAQAAELGLPHANGLAMLVHQGVRALEIWTGAAVPAATMRAAADRTLAAHQS